MKKQGQLFFTPLKGKQIFTNMFFLNNDFALSIIEDVFSDMLIYQYYSKFKLL